MRRPTTRITLPLAEDCRDCRLSVTPSVVKHGHRSGIRWQVVQINSRCTEHATMRLHVNGRAGEVVVTMTRDASDHMHLSAYERLFADLHALTRNVPLPHARVTEVARVPELAAGDPGADSETVLLWALAGFRTADEVAAARALELDATEAQQWAYMLGLTDPRRANAPLRSVEDLLAWWAVSRDNPLTGLSETNRWLRMGVYRPEDRPAGLSVNDMAVLRDSGLDPDPGWAGAEHVCPDLLSVAAGMGHSPAGTVALCRALRSYALPTGYCHHATVIDCQWHGVARRIAEDVLPGFADVDWADGAACLRAGMDPHEAIAHLRSGAEMEPVRLLAALTG